MDLSVLWVAAVTISLMMIAVWAISVKTRDVSIIDIAWGSGFVLVGWAVRLTTDGNPTRQNLLVALTTIWGLRLALYLARRNLGHGEDRRYVRMRKKRGENFWLISLVTVFLLQGVVMWVVSLPVQLGQAKDTPLGFFAVLGALVWAIGMFFEAVGDYQLRRFKADPANEGAILNAGLWGWTRHPNYFGDACVWAGLGIIAAEVGGLAVLFCLLSPLVMTLFLVQISGKALLERDLVRRRPGYAAYVASTSGFFPLPPRR